jgi:Mn-dependent DtxR family transcriptional regulator
MNRRDEDVLDYIRRFILNNGYAPPLTDIRKALRMKTQEFDTSIKRLGRQGLIEYKGKASAITVKGLQVIDTEKDGLP